MKAKIIVPDAGPLFSFAAIDGGLDLILAAGLPIGLTDYVAWEATRSDSDLARLIGSWIAAHPDAIQVVETELGQVRIAQERTGAAPKRERKNLGEVTIFEALSEGDFGEGPFLFLFEEDRFVDPGFYGRHPVHSVTTMAFLVGLERRRIITDADAVLDAMRLNGRRGVKRLVIDRPHRIDRGLETSWRP